MATLNKGIMSSNSEDPINTASWMSLLLGTVKINELVMPGSHDAGMSELDHCDLGSALNTGLVKTQELNIRKQLEAGARYFDIRVDYDHGNLVTYHRSGNIGCNGQSLVAIINQCIEFLKSYNTETFILKFSHIRSNRGKDREIKDRIEQFLSNISYREFLFTYAKADVNIATIALEVCRGKIILVFDYPEYITPRQGRFRYNDGFISTPDGVMLDKQCQPNLTVFDCYSNTAELERMKNDQLEKLDKYGGLGKEYLYLLSWTLTPNANTFFEGSSVKKLAANANPELMPILKERMHKKEKPLPNIVYVDYINKEISQNIIQCNLLNH